MDADGDVDLVVGHYYDQIWHYENTAGPGTTPVFASHDTLIDDPFGGADAIIAPSVVDWDGDGDLDLVAGSRSSGVRVFWNSGDATSPSFSVDSYQQLIAPAAYAYHSPAHVDWDSDGDWDLLVGTFDGYVQFHENQSGLLVCQGLLSTALGPIDVSYDAQPDVVDWNNDGTYDVLVGDYYGTVQLFCNGPPTAMALGGSVSGGTLTLVWDDVPGAAFYWIYGADNLTYFEPGLTMPWWHRRADVPAGTTTWSSPNGVGDPDHNWTYQIIAMDAALQDISRSNRFGEHDFSMGAAP